jgi:hypothetical protein
MADEIALRFDAADRPHVAFLRFEHWETAVFAAIREDDGWTVERVTADESDRLPALALTEDGMHIVFSRGTRVGFHARRTSSGWSKDAIYRPDEGFRAPGLASDGRGGLHMAYRGSGAKLVYAHHSGLGWVTQEITRFNLSGHWPGTAVAVHDKHPHIVYVSENGLELAH